jgi:hypothetical protein
MQTWLARFCNMTANSQPNVYDFGHENDKAGVWAAFIGHSRSDCDRWRIGIACSSI